MARTLNAIASEAIFNFRSAQDRFDSGDATRGFYEFMVECAYVICTDCFETLRSAPSQHIYQKVRVINVASEMIRRREDL